MAMEFGTIRLREIQAWLSWRFGIYGWFQAQGLPITAGLGDAVSTGLMDGREEINIYTVRP
jgi:hypothetical protein